MRASLQKVLLPAMALVVVAGMVGCDGREQSTQTPPAASVSDGPDPNEREAPWSEMNLEHVRSSSSLQAQGGPVQFKARGAVLSTDMSMYTVYVNRSIVDKATLRVDGDMLTVASALKDGINPVSVYGPDAKGALVVHKTAIWAGTASVQGTVVDESGNPVAGATVVGALTDDPTVTATTTTDSAGRYVLNNFPHRTVMVTATATGNLSGTTTSVAGTDFPDIVFWSFGTPVPTPNNDFSRGTEGWINRSGPPPALVDHIENPGPQSAASSPTVLARLMRWSPFSTAQAQAPSRKPLRWSTSGHGPHTTSYTFIPPADIVTATGSGDLSGSTAGMAGTEFPNLVWYCGYSARDAGAAAKMLAMLNTPGVGTKVKLVYVSHTPRPGNAFYDAYKDATLADGRRSDSVIQNYAGHGTHFHWSMPGPDD